jgi:hypothetical protein
MNCYAQAVDSIATMEHVLIRNLDFLTGDARRPSLQYAIEMRERPGPAHKIGAFPDDTMWIQLQGGLMVAKARVLICWRGEYSLPKEIRARTRGSEIHGMIDFWRRRPKSGYAAVAELEHESWIEPFWAGPRTYGYEWVLLENDKKRQTWLDRRPPPRSSDDLRVRFVAWKRARAG